MHAEPEFYDYFRAVTPIDVIERMQIGSRPVHRSGHGTPSTRFAPCPGCFAWTQPRHMLPGWFGAGTGLYAVDQEVRRDARARDVYASGSSCAISSMTWKPCSVVRIWRSPTPTTCSRPRHAAPFLRADPRGIRASAVHQVLAIKGCSALLDSDATLQRSIQLRNPYVDPMNLMQVDLLQRWRATDRQDRDLFEALLASISGIAQGLQSTG